jgi:O-antigen ligase
VPRTTLVAVALFAALAGWSVVSVLWSSDRGIAWDGANRTLLYLTVFALFALLPWPRPGIPLLLCGFSLAVLVIGLADLARATWGSPAGFFIHGRLAAPAGYPNGACALYLMSFWVLAYAAARREPPPLARGFLLGAATALVELAVLAESRGSLFAVPVAAVVYLLVVPKRLRAGITLVVAGVAVLAARGPLLDVYDPVRTGADVGGVLHHAYAAIAISSGLIFVFWTLVALFDRRVELRPRQVRLANGAALIAVALVIVGAGIAVASAQPGPLDRISSGWRHFKAGYTGTVSSSHFSSGLGNNRYDFWRVALLDFKRHPLNGVGVDNFAEDYVRLRRSNEEPLYPHSLELRVLAQLGIVGGVLFAGLVAAIGVGVIRAARERGDFVAGMARAGVAGTMYWAIHGSADWFWEFPGLTAPAVAWLGLALARPSPRAERETSGTRRLGVWLWLPVVALVAVSLVLPWLSELEVQRATAVWRRDPGRAFAELDRARGLNPLGSQPDLLGGAIASRVDKVGRMQRFFRRAVDRDSHNWYAHFELGLADAALGNRARALAELRQAGLLNPGEPVIHSVRRQVVAGRTVDRARIDEVFAERVRSRLGR